MLATASSNDSARRIPETAALRLLLDLQSGQSIKALNAYLTSSERLNLVVVASGRVGFGSALDTAPSDVIALMTANFLGVVNLLTGLRPALQPGAKVVVVTGVVAERAFPNMAAYCASKSALASWLDSVRQEWRRDGIAILDAQPGHTETGLATRPLFGVAPPMPTGMNPDSVVQRILSEIQTDTQILKSQDFG